MKDGCKVILALLLALSVTACDGLGAAGLIKFADGDTVTIVRADTYAQVSCADGRFVGEPQYQPLCSPAC